jgi:hypothetical protein
MDHRLFTHIRFQVEEQMISSMVDDMILTKKSSIAAALYELF